MTLIEKLGLFLVLGAIYFAPHRSTSDSDPMTAITFTMFIIGWLVFSFAGNRGEDEDQDSEAGLDK